MLESLKNLVGLSAGVSSASTSGLYVDALPDISTEIIHKLTEDEGSTLNMWSEIEDRTILKFRTLFITELNKTHKLHKRDICECLIEENADMLATSLWYLLGAEVMLTRKYSSRINSATIDRNKAGEVREYFEEQFAKELSAAVNAIDIHESDCIPNCEDVPVADIVTTHTPII